MFDVVETDLILEHPSALLAYKAFLASYAYARRLWVLGKPALFPQGTYWLARHAPIALRHSLRIGLDLEEQSSGISALLAKYGKRMDLADACVVRMSELTKRCVVLTLDRKGFAIYRRNGRYVIPLIAPARSEETGR